MPWVIEHPRSDAPASIFYKRAGRKKAAPEAAGWPVRGYRPCGGLAPWLEALSLALPLTSWPSR